ncbi:caspase family protein [Sphaerothrix gracilis]|uniref:caspase family protein n=1 Tax=Sphaerothrix gracilis TaxID=3151835 RepID=UPI0031FD4BE8
MVRDALVVGVSHYQKLPRLQSPSYDAEAIASCLQNHGEFRVHRMPEIIESSTPKVGQHTAVTTRQLENALIQLFKPAGKHVPQTAVFYFSGHGFQREAGIREGYLATSETDPEMGIYGLSLFWLRRLLQESPVPQKVIWLDCCHSGELLNFLEADPGAHQGSDRLFMAASREFESAYQSLGSNYSVFTEALLAGLKPEKSETGIVTNHSLLRSVSQQLKGEIQQPLFETSGSEIMLTRSSGRTATLSTSPVPTLDRLKQFALKFCPYQGLSAFTERHGDFFFGREEATAQLLQSIERQRFCAVIGASSSGKTSLLRAGLIHQLQQNKLPGSRQWQIRYITPTDSPLTSLAAAFIDPNASGLVRAEQLRQAMSFLQAGGQGLNQLVQTSFAPQQAATQTFIQQQTQLQTAAKPQLLLVIDQLEELFSHCQEEFQRQQFLDCILQALQEPETRLRVVVALRGDYQDALNRYPTLSVLMRQNLLVVPPLSYEKIKSTITEPAKKLKIQYDPNLLYSILLDIVGAPGELPLLQLTLAELWQRQIANACDASTELTLEAYAELGGVRQILSQRATAVYESLTEAEQQAARRIFLCLCELGEGAEDSRRRIQKAELINHEFSAELIEQTLEKLVTAKLVIVNSAQRSDQTQPRGQWPKPAPRDRLAPVTRDTVDIVHESLIRNWSLLREWLQDKREILRQQRRLEAAAQEWQQQGQPLALDYLLSKNRLSEAELFWQRHPSEPSALAQQYLKQSRQVRRRTYLQVGILGFLLPCMVSTGLVWLLSSRQGAQEALSSAQRGEIAEMRSRSGLASLATPQPSAAQPRTTQTEVAAPTTASPLEQRQLANETDSIETNFSAADIASLLQLQISQTSESQLNTWECPPTIFTHQAIMPTSAPATYSFSTSSSDISAVTVCQ